MTAYYVIVKDDDLDIDHDRSDSSIEGLDEYLLRQNKFFENKNANFSANNVVAEDGQVHTG